MNRRPVARWVFIAAVVAVAGAGLALLFAPRAVPVELATVARGPIAETVYDQGQARVRDTYVAAAPVAGLLRRITLKVGDRVVAGQPVARLVPAAPSLLDPALRAQRQEAVKAAAAELERARAEQVRAEQLLGRVRPLAALGDVSKQTLDDAGAAQRQATAAVDSAEHALAAARAALIGPEARGTGSVAVTVPSDGYVTRVLEPSERTVASGTPLIEISDHRQLEAVIEFLSEDAARIRPGMAAEVYDWGGPAALTAVVRRVEPQGFTKISALGVEEQRALVWLSITDPPERWSSLGPGYRVWGRVFLRREVAAVKAPLGTLQRNAGGWAVFRNEGGRARLRAVGVGAIDEREAEVTRGVVTGDQLVVFPSDMVRDGVRIRPRS